MPLLGNKSKAEKTASGAGDANAGKNAGKTTGGRPRVDSRSKWVRILAKAGAQGSLAYDRIAPLAMCWQQFLEDRWIPYLATENGDPVANKPNKDDATYVWLRHRPLDADKWCKGSFADIFTVPTRAHNYGTDPDGNTVHRLEIKIVHAHHYLNDRDHGPLHQIGPAIWPRNSGVKRTVVMHFWPRRLGGDDQWHWYALIPLSRPTPTTPTPGRPTPPPGSPTPPPGRPTQPTGPTGPGPGPPPGSGGSGTPSGPSAPGSTPGAPPGGGGTTGGGGGAGPPGGGGGGSTTTPTPTTTPQGGPAPGPGGGVPSPPIGGSGDVPTTPVPPIPLPGMPGGPLNPFPGGPTAGGGQTQAYNSGGGVSEMIPEGSVAAAHAHHFHARQRTPPTVNERTNESSERTPRSLPPSRGLLGTPVWDRVGFMNPRPSRGLLGSPAPLDEGLLKRAPAVPNFAKKAREAVTSITQREFDSTKEELGRVELVERIRALAAYVEDLNERSRGYISGAGLTFGTVSTVTAGASGETSAMSDSTNTKRITFEGVLTADIAVSGVGGLDTGAEAADTWYAVHVIADTRLQPNSRLQPFARNPVALLLSTSVLAPTLPDGYDVFRRVGWVRNDSASDFRAFLQVLKGESRLYQYDVDRGNVQALSGGNATIFTAVALANFLPPDVERAHLGLVMDSGGVNNDLRLRPTGSGITLAGALYRFEPGTTQLQSIVDLEMTVGIDQQIDFAVTSPADAADIFVKGFEDGL